MLTLKHVLTALTQLNSDTFPTTAIQNVVIDSRQAGPGSLFVALPGENVDGHNYVAQAFEQGAIAALTHQPVGAFNTVTPQSAPASWHGPLCIQVADSLQGLQDLAAYWRRQFSLRVTGITGSVGKTSTKELSYRVVAQKYRPLYTQGNYNNEIGLPLTILQLDDKFDSAVLEMGMYDVGEISTLCQITQPQIGVVTNIGPSHLERLGTMERIVEAKRELVESLPADGVAVLNRDDPLVMSMAPHTKAQVFTYGLSEEADLWADEIYSAGLEGMQFVLHHAGEALHVKVPLLGRHSVHTALRAAAVGLHYGLRWDEIIAGLQDKAAQLRLVAIPGPNESLLLDDTYNASPASGIAALNLLAELNATRKIAVLGDMAELGSFEEAGHRKVGCRAASVVDLLITLGPKAKLIAEEALACGLKTAQVHTLMETEAVLAHLRNIAQPGDTILIKGSRSLAMETIVAELSQSGSRA